MERDDTVAGPGQNSPSESAPDSRGVEFVRGSDYDYWEDGLIATLMLSSGRDLVQGWSQEAEVARQALKNVLAQGWVPPSEQGRQMVERLRAAGLLPEPKKQNSKDE